MSTSMRGGFIELRVFEVEKLPISNPKTYEKEIIKLVENILELNKNYNSLKTDSDKKLYQQKIDILDSQIDRLVYELYELTEDEIKIIEESVK